MSVTVTGIGSGQTSIAPSLSVLLDIANNAIADLLNVENRLEILADHVDGKKDQPPRTNPDEKTKREPSGIVDGLTNALAKMGKIISRCKSELVRLELRVGDIPNVPESEAPHE